MSVCWSGLGTAGDTSAAVPFEQGVQRLAWSASATVFWDVPATPLDIPISLFPQRGDLLQGTRSSTGRGDVGCEGQCGDPQAGALQVPPQHCFLEKGPPLPHNRL